MISIKKHNQVKNINFIAIIPARRGSKGIKNKNVIKINGKKMIEYSILSSSKCKKIEKVFLTTNDEKILKLSKKYKKIETLKRNEILSTSVALLSDVINDALKRIIKKYPKVNHFILLQPTSPQRTFKDIENAIKFYEKNNYKNLISVSEPINNPYELIFLKQKSYSLIINRKRQLNRQSYKKSYFINGSIFIGSIKKFLKKKKFLDKNSVFFKMEKKHSIDINDNFDKQLIKSFI